MNNSNGAVQALNVGGTLTDHITVATADGTNQVVTITINGTNDAAIISGTTVGAVTEAGGVANGTPGTPTAIGTLTDTDVDNAANSFQAVAAGTATTDGYGTYAMKIGRAAWRERDNSKAAVQALNVGGTLTDHITVASEDGTTQVVTITINGTNDAAITSGSPIASVTGAGGVDMGTPGTPTASGTLTDTDVDNAANSFQAVAAGTASTDGFGTYAMTAGGTWTYTLDNSNAAVQALNVGGTLTDHITVASEDGTTQVVTITINGANDAPVAVADVNAGNEDSLITGTVATNDSDVDSAALVYSLNAPVAGLTLNANGSYSLDASNAAYQQLAQGATLPVVANYTVTDDHGATSVSTLTITLSGVNDAPVITSNGGGATAALSVAENSTAVTTVTSSDVDTGATATYSIAGGADAALFTINSASGALAFLLAPNFESPTDAGSNNVYDVIVRVSDGLATDTQAIAVTVTPVNEFAPVITSNGGGATASISIAENSTTVTTVVATDADLPAASLVYSISGGADAAKFTISSSGAISFLSAPNFELPTDAGANNVYDVTVQVSDGIFTDSQAIAVTVTDVSEVTNDIYSFGLAAGNNTINDAGGIDAIKINGTPVTSLNFQRVGNDLVIDANSTHITVTSHYAGTNAVESISFS